MGGNVWQWCEDKYDIGDNIRVLRGGAFYTMDSDNALSSFRGHSSSSVRLTGIGFRVVVVISP